MQYLSSCIRFIDESRHYGNVLVHCRQGVSRSASVVLAYLMKTKHLSYDEAFAFVKARRPRVSPNSSFSKQLRQFERRLCAERNIAKRKMRTEGRTEDRDVVKRRRTIGPQKPPTSKTNTEKPPIGPQLPPPTRSRSLQDLEEDKNRSSRNDKSVASKRTRRVIGPSLPSEFGAREPERTAPPPSP